MFRRFTTFAAALALLATACGSDASDPVAGDTTAPATGTTPTADPGTEADPTTGGSDCGGAIGVMGPFTGDAASIGLEQLNWARFAVDRFNEEHDTSFTLVEGDTQLDPAQATTVAQQFLADDSILAVVGPAGSQEVEAIGPIFDGGLAMISASATSTDLTEDGIDGFFRVVPRDDVQGPTDANFMIDELGAERVTIIDDQTSYSTGLADVTAETLEAEGVEVARDSVNQDQTDFSSLVSGIDADVVFIPWQIAANAQLFAQQMEEQGKDATIFGADGLFSPEDFTAEGAYVSAFAPDIRGIPGTEELVADYTEQYGDFGTFGPPVFAATQVAMTAAVAACEESGGEPDRESVLAQVSDVRLTDSILGGELTFDDKGDVGDAEFFIFQITGGEYTLVE